MALAAMAACLLIASPSALAADGDLDADFDFDGFRTHDCGFSDTEGTLGSNMALQPDGKILLLTRAHSAEATGPACVTRLTATGALDRDFGTDGDVLLNDGAGVIGGSVVVQPDGRIVVGGTLTGANYDAIVYRLNPDGGPDTSFDGDGKATLSFGVSGSDSTDDLVNDVAVQADGRIVVAGRAVGGTDAHTGAARLTADGALDTSFSGDGRTIESFGGEGDFPSAIALDGDRIVLAGFAEPASPTGASGQFAATRLNADGTRDASFGPAGNGQTIVPLGDSSAASDAIVTPDAGLLLTGSVSQSGGLTKAAVLKLDAGGRPDASFSADGIQLVDFGAGSAGSAASITVDGKFAIAGSATGGGTRLAAAKLTLAGALDPSFGDAGTRVYAGVPVASRAIARQANGKLIIGGRTGTGSGVARVDDSVPVVSITGGSVTEGQVVPFQIALSKTSGFPVSVNFITGEGSAAEGVDYLGRSGSVAIPAGQTTANLGFASIRDRLLEPNEQFRVEISNPVGAALGGETALGTILNVLRSGRCANLLIGRGRIDILTGSAVGDEIFGRTGADQIFGLRGDDCLYGERGNDEINGGDGNDYVSGGAQDDRLFGGNGNDRLYGGRGRNTYSGGSGSDVILARNGKTEKIDCGAGRDRAKVDRADRVRNCEKVTRS
jgi:uncharacterized delta-60 repeat protein